MFSAQFEIRMTQTKWFQGG